MVRDIRVKQRQVEAKEDEEGKTTSGLHAHSTHRFGNAGCNEGT